MFVHQELIHESLNRTLFIIIFMTIVCCTESAIRTGNCDVANYSAGSAKCVWSEQGGNLTESEKSCGSNEGVLFTFNSIQEGIGVLEKLNIEENVTTFVGAIRNNQSHSLYYDWLSRPGTWSAVIQSEVVTNLNDSLDDNCLVLENGKLRRESCSSKLTISVCEKVIPDNCSCTNLSVIPNSPKMIQIEILQDSTESPFTLSDVTLHSPDEGTTILADLGKIRVDKENKSTNYCDYVDVLNITFGDLIDQIFAQSNKENISGSSCQGQQSQGQQWVTTEATVEAVEEKSTIPVTEVKFQFVSGIEFGPAMTGSMINPPLRIDKHSQDYSLLVNISRELMEFQSTKQATNQTLTSFAESVTNWTKDDGLIKETTDVQDWFNPRQRADSDKDLFEDILQVGEDLVGNITTDQDEVKVTSGSIAVVSKVIKSTNIGTHTTIDLDQPSRDVDLRLANTIFSNKTVKVRVSTITYGGMGTIAKRVDQRVASSIVSVSVKYIVGRVVEKQTIDTEEAIIFALRTFLHKDKKEQSRLCSYWSFTARQWSTAGCSVIDKNSSLTTCKCNHLTNFAILVMYMDTEDISLQSQQVLFTLTTVGCSLSIACLAMTLITYAYLRMLGNEKIMIHANLSLALMMAQIVFVSSHDAHNHATACKVVALLLHFLFMASFAWMMVEGIALYMTCTRGILANINRDMKLRYFLIGWGLPAIIVIISCAAQFPNYGAGPQYSCWLSTQSGLIWAFLGPMLLIVVLNMIVMGLVVKVFLTLRANTEKSELARLRGSLRAMMTLLPLLGLGWILSLLVPLSVVFNYFFVIVNTLQGMCIFFLHCICNEEIRKMFHEKRRRWSTTRTASDFDITFHARRKTGSFDGIRTIPTTATTDLGRRQVWIEK